MTYLLEEELTSQGIATKTTLKIRFNDKVYVRVKTLPMQFYEQARKLKEDYIAQNRDSLIIEHKTWIAIWVEELTHLEEIDDDYSYTVKDLSSNFTDTNPQLAKIQEIRYLNDEESLVLPKSSPSTSRKKYRGVKYSDEVSNSSPDIVPPEKSTRKYRGIAYNDQDTSNDSRNIKKSKQFTRQYRGSSY